MQGVIRRGTYNLKYAKGFLRASTQFQQPNTSIKNNNNNNVTLSKAQTTFFCSFFGILLIFWSAKFCKLLALNALLSDERSRSGSRSSSGCRSCSRSRSYSHCPSLMLWLWLWPCAVFQYIVNCGHDKETSLEALFAEKHNVMWLSFSTMFG